MDRLFADLASAASESFALTPRQVGLRTMRSGVRQNCIAGSNLDRLLVGHEQTVQGAKHMDVRSTNRMKRFGQRALGHEGSRAHVNSHAKSHTCVELFLSDPTLRYPPCHDRHHSLSWPPCRTRGGAREVL
jgi:hypothetical protein